MDRQRLGEKIPSYFDYRARVIKGPACLFEMERIVDVARFVFTNKNHRKRDQESEATDPGSGDTQ
jgi:hypothetical protein